MSGCTTNIQDVIDQLTRIKGKIPPQVRKEMKDSCIVIVATAKDYCTPGMSPYDSMVFPTKGRYGKGKGLGRMGLGTVWGEGNIKSGAPFQIGDLRRHNDYVVSEDDDAHVEGVVLNNAGHAVYVHEGTSKMQARPFLLDAVKAKQDNTDTNIWKGVNAAVEEALK